MGESTLASVVEVVRELLTRCGVSVRGVRVPAVHVQSGEPRWKRLVVESELASPSDVDRARSALQSEREALSYPGLSLLRIRLTAPGARGRDVDIAQRRILPAPGPLARRPGSGAKATLDLSSFFTPDGLLGDANDDRIPDRIDALLVPSGDGVRGTVDLAGRLGLESTGISIPAARRAEAITEPEEEPALVLIGQDHPLVRELTDRNKVVLPPLAAGEGWIQVIPKAFGDKSAVVITGGDAPSVERALRQVSERFPNIWSRGKDRTTLDGIEDDVWGFLSGRSPAGQAATALYKLEQLAKELAYKELASAEVAVYVEKAEEGLESSVRERAEQVLSADTLKVTVEDLHIQNARTLIDEDIEITSEVDDFWGLVSLAGSSRCEKEPAGRHRGPAERASGDPRIDRRASSGGAPRGGSGGVRHVGHGALRLQAGLQLALRRSAPGSREQTGRALDDPLCRARSARRVALPDHVRPLAMAAGDIPHRRDSRSRDESGARAD